MPTHLPIVITRLRTLLLQYCYSGLSRWVFEAKYPTSYLIFTKGGDAYPCRFVSACLSTTTRLLSYIGLGRPPASPATTLPYATITTTTAATPPVWLLGPNENVERTQSL